MSVRRKPGDIVAISGYSGYPGRYRIQDYPPLSCWHSNCDDEGCQEWATLDELDGNGNPTGEIACHICECEMEDPS